MAGKKKNKIELKVIKGNNVSTQDAPDMKEHDKVVKRGEKKEKAVRSALIISRLDHPVNVRYGKSIIRLSPRCSERVGDIDMLDVKELPNGIFVKKIVKAKK